MPQPEPRLVTRLSQSDLVELVMREQEPPPPQYINESKSFTTKTVTHNIENVPNGRSDYSPNVKRTYQTSTYNTGNETSPKPPRPSYERGRDPVRKSEFGSPSTLRSAMSKPKRNDFDPFSLEEVTIHKGQGPLGLSIVGGRDHSCRPFGQNGDDQGVFISKVRTIFAL